MKVLSIDVGITNLGFVYSDITFNEPKDGSRYKHLLLNSCYSLNKSFLKENIKIIDCNKIDITKVKHRKVPFCICKLHHDRCIPDYLDHFIQETSYFEECDVLLIERQPPVGITNVQDLLFKQFRDKVLLISPNSVHKYFGLNNVYEERKEKSEKTSQYFLEEFDNFKKHIRKHDISDAMLMILYYYKTEMDTIIKNHEFKYLDDFDKFRFIK